MRKYRRKWLPCLLMVSLLGLTPSLPCGAAVMSVPEGWQAPEAGYWMPERDGRDMLQALRTYREEAEAWEAAAHEMSAAMEATREELRSELDALAERMNAAIGQAVDSAIAQERSRLTNQWWFQLAVFGGLGYLAGQ